MSEITKAMLIVGTMDPPVAHQWTSGAFTTLEWARTFYRCSQCWLYFRDHVDFVSHLSDQGECVRGAE